MRLTGTHRTVLAALALAIATIAVGVRPQHDPPRRPPLPKSVSAAPTQPSPSIPSPDELVRKLAERSTNWIAPSLESLEYDAAFGSEITHVKVSRGEQRRYGAWIGTTLHAGFHELMKSPDKFAIEISRGADAKRLTLVARLKDDTTRIRVDAGNLSHPARGTLIVVDAERFVPLEEQTCETTIRYSDWQEVGAGNWVPRQVDVVGLSVHNRTHFNWLGDAVWLAASSELISPEGIVTLTRVKNVKVNGRDVAVPATDAQRRSHEAARPILAMLDHNRTWLHGGATGAGWRPPFKTLSYTFHTVREDFRESCVMDSNGEVAF